MPELPDVEAMRLAIEPDVVGRTFTRVTLNWPRAVRHPSPGEFQEGLVGAEVTGLRRRAKYFLFDLDVDDTLIIHLRMTGSLRVTPTAEPLHRYTQTIFHFADGRDLLTLHQESHQLLAGGAIGGHPGDNLLSDIAAFGEAHRRGFQPGFR